MRRPIILIVAAVLVAGYSWWLWLADRPLEKVGRVRIAASSTVSPAPIWIALDRGFFVRAGLDATIQRCDTGKDCTEAMLEGEADLSAATEFLAARVAFNDKDLRILGTTAYIHAIKLLARRDGGIAALADLKGKRVGVKLGTNGEYFLARLLTLNGLARGDIAWVDLKPQAMAEALADGRVDATLVWPPFTQKIKAQLGGEVLEFDGQPGQDYYYLVLGQRDWLEANPKIAERVMLALTWAEEWMEAHPGEVRAYLADKHGVPAADLDADLASARFSIDLPQSLLVALEAEGRWLAEQGTKGVPVANTLDLIAFSPLAEVAPEAVTMVHSSER